MNFTDSHGGSGIERMQTGDIKNEWTTDYISVIVLLLTNFLNEPTKQHHHLYEFVRKCLWRRISSLRLPGFLFCTTLASKTANTKAHIPHRPARNGVAVVSQFLSHALGLRSLRMAMLVGQRVKTLWL